jgi:hypothetical protein
MRPDARLRHPLTRAAAVVLSFVLLAGSTECTYRSGNGNTGTRTPAQLTQGTVSAFGSVVVDGVEYRTTSVSVTLDGANAVEADLRPGQVIALRGRLDSGSTAGRADTISGDAALVGTVGGRDPGAGSVSVLGTRVQMNGNTSFGGELDGAVTAPLAVGDRVVVWGWSGTDTAVLATRIELAAARRDLQVAGRVSSFDGALRRYTVRGTVVDYSAAGTVPGLANGVYAAAFGTATNADGSLRAQRVSVRDEAPAAENRDRGDVEGVITRFASSADFDVGGRTITTTTRTTYVNGAATDLRPGILLVARGEFDADRRLVATRIEFARDPTFRVLAPIESFNVATTTFTGGGVQVQTDASTRWEDRTALASRTFRFGELRTGEWIDARGYEGSAARSATASVVERRAVPTDLRFELQGRAQNLVSPNLAIVGVPVLTTNAEFRDAAGSVLTRVQFYGQAVDRTVVARGRFSGTTLVADSVQIRP